MKTKVIVFIIHNKNAMRKIAAILAGAVALGLYANACFDEGDSQGRRDMRLRASRFIPDFEERYEKWILGDITE